MKKILVGVSLLLLLCVPGLASEPKDLAFEAAETFAMLIDEGNFQAAYWSGSPLLHLANIEEVWLDKVARKQQIMGKTLQRNLKRVRAVTSPADLPDDDYRIILFDTRTERKAKAAEVLILHRVDGIWRVCDYSIR